MINEEIKDANSLGNQKTPKVYESIRSSKGGYVLLILAIGYIGFNYLLPMFVHFIEGEVIWQIGRILSVLLILCSLKDFPKLRFIGKYLAFTITVCVIWGLVEIGNQAINVSFSEIGVLSSFYDLISTIAIYIVFVNLTERHENAARILLMAFAGFAFLNVLVALYSVVTGHSLYISKVAAGSIGYDPATGRITGFRGENYVGLWTAPLLSIALFSIFKPGRRILALLIPFIIASITVSLSRTSIVSSVVVILIWVMIVFRSKRRLWIMAIILILIPPTLWGISQALTNQSRMMDSTVIAAEKHRFTVDNRSAIWRYWIGFAVDHPMGVGPEGIRSMVSETGKKGAIPHNSFLEVLVAYGMVGFILYCIPWYLSLHSFKWFIRKKNYDHDLAVLVSAFWGMFISLQLLSNPFMKIVFVVAGCIEGRKQFLIRQTTEQARLYA